MKILKGFVLRLFIYLLLFLGFLILRDNDILRIIITPKLPEPTQFSRAPDQYDFQSFGSALQAGFSKREITPEGFSWLAGFEAFRPALLVNDPLWVKSLALADERGNVIVIVSCDLIGLLPDEIKKIKSAVKGINPSQIFISTTHTHSGPDTIGLWGMPPVLSGKREKYFVFLRKQINQSIEESIANLQEARIRFAVSELKGHSLGRKDNPADFSVSVMQVLISGKFPVTLVNYANHPDVFKTLHISADFPYYLAERLRCLTGGETIFLPGAIGGVQSTDGELGFYYAKVIGENLADKVYRALKKPIIPKEFMISVERAWVYAPLENEGFVKAAEFGLISDLRSEGNQLIAEVGRITIGPAEILTVPGELFPGIWWKVKPLMKGRPNFIFGLTDGEYGYIMLPRDFDSQNHKYHTSMSVGPTFGTEIEKTLKKLLTEH